MNFLKFKEESQPTFQIAPLIDIMFLVLIFFIAASVFQRIETEIPIDIPIATQSVVGERTPGKIIINVDKEGRIVINEREFDLDRLKAVLQKISENFPNQAVIIRADKRSSYGRIIEVLDTCMAAKIWNISFATLKSKE